MSEDKLYLALIITFFLAILIFRANYTSDLKASRKRYAEYGKHVALQITADLASAISFALIGCFLFWDSVTFNSNFSEWKDWKFLLSIIVGLVFQQILPILLEIVLDKVNSIRNSLIAKRENDDRGRN